MKKIFLSALVALLLMSCKKDLFKDIRREAAGTWEYHRYYGFWGPSQTLPRGNGKLMVIGTDGSFEQRNHDTVTFHGSYEFNERKDCYGDSRKIFFKTSNPALSENIIEINDDTLSLSSSNCLSDGGGVIYLRN
jgi:hypothetical protein